MNDLERDCAVISLFYENAEAQIVNDYFVESAVGDKLKSAGRRISKAIQDIIASLKKFFQDMRDRSQAKKAEKAIKEMAKDPKRKVKKIIKNKEFRKSAKQVLDLEVKTCNEMKKQHDQFVSGKITYEQFVSRVTDLYTTFEAASGKFNLSCEVVSIQNPVGYMELAKSAMALNAEYTKIVTDCENTCLQYEEKLAAEASRIDDAINKMETGSGEKDTPEKLKKIGAAKAFLASKISAVGHRSVSYLRAHPVLSGTVLTMLGINVIGTAVAKKKIDKIMNDDSSTDDLFDEDGDDFDAKEILAEFLV